MASSTYQAAPASATSSNTRNTAMLPRSAARTDPTRIDPKMTHSGSSHARSALRRLGPVIAPRDGNVPPSAPTRPACGFAPYGTIPPCAPAPGAPVPGDPPASGAPASIGGAPWPYPGGGGAPYGGDMYGLGG